MARNKLLLFNIDVDLDYSYAGQDFYLVYELGKEDVSAAFGHAQWDIRKLEGFAGCRQSGRPFFVTVTALMTIRETK